MSSSLGPAIVLQPSSSSEASLGQLSSASDSHEAMRYLRNVPYVSPSAASSTNSHPPPSVFVESSSSQDLPIVGEPTLAQLSRNASVISSSSSSSSTSEAVPPPPPALNRPKLPSRVFSSRSDYHADRSGAATPSTPRSIKHPSYIARQYGMVMQEEEDGSAADEYVLGATAATPGRTLPLTSAMAKRSLSSEGPLAAMAAGAGAGASGTVRGPPAGVRALLPSNMVTAATHQLATMAIADGERSPVVASSPTTRRPAQNRSRSNTAVHRYSVNDFDVLGVLGEGSFSEVRKATYRRTGQVYALKIVNRDHLVRKKEVQTAFAEKNSLVRLSHNTHPGVVRLHWAFADNINLYFVLDKVDNGELAFRITKLGSLSLDCCRYYTAQIADAAVWMHSQGVIHRDLKPENVLLTNEGRAKITDFGTAECLPEGATDGRATSFVGSPGYISPELLHNSWCSFSADFWALGCILLYMLSGAQPFKAETNYLSMEKTKKGLFDVPADADPHAALLVRDFLTLEPTERLGDRARGGGDAIKSHAFFHDIRWDELWTSDAPPMQPGLVRNPHADVDDPFAHDHDDDEFFTGSKSNAMWSGVDSSDYDIDKQSSSDHLPSQTTQETAKENSDPHRMQNESDYRSLEGTALAAGVDGGGTPLSSTFKPEPPSVVVRSASLTQTAYPHYDEDGAFIPSISSSAVASARPSPERDWDAHHDESAIDADDDDEDAQHVPSGRGRRSSSAAGKQRRRLKNPRTGTSPRPISRHGEVVAWDTHYRRPSAPEISIGGRENWTNNPVESGARTPRSASSTASSDGSLPGTHSWSALLTPTEKTSFASSVQERKRGMFQTKNKQRLLVATDQDRLLIVKFKHDAEANEDSVEPTTSEPIAQISKEILLRRDLGNVPPRLSADAGEAQRSSSVGRPSQDGDSTPPSITPPSGRQGGANRERRGSSISQRVAVIVPSGVRRLSVSTTASRISMMRGRAAHRDAAEVFVRVDSRDERTFAVVTDQSSYTFVAESAMVANRWLQELRRDR